MPVVNYQWDTVEDNIIEEFDDSGTTVADYTTGPDLYGNVISQSRDGVTSQFHFDALGSTIALTGTDMNTTAGRSYSAFGTVTESFGATDFQFQYGGQKG